MIILAYLLLGAIAGLLAGLFGIGGGVVLVPAFILLFEFQGVPAELIVYMAIGSSLACIVFSAAMSAWTHHRQGAVDWNIFWRLVPGIAIGAWLGVHTAVGIPAAVLQLIIGVFLVLIAIKMLRGIQLSKKQRDQLPGAAGLLAAGGIIGWVSAIFGIGGGTLTVPFLQHCKVLMQRAVATSSACGLPIALVGVATNAYVGWGQPQLPAGSLGYVLLPAVVAVVVSSIPCANLGARLAHRLPAAQLKHYFAWFVALVGSWLVIRFFL